MKASRRIDRSVCGAVLSARVPLPTTSPVSSRSPPSRCIHDQRRKPQHRRSRTVTNWIPAAGATDPASGTLLPMLFPPAWTSSWKRPTAYKAMHILESACHSIGRSSTASNDMPSNVARTRANHTSAAAAAAPTPREFSDAFEQTDDQIGHHTDEFTHSTTPMAAVPAIVVPDTKFLRPRRLQLTKSELLSYVDPPADGDTVDEHLAFIRDPYLRRYAEADDRPGVRVSDARAEDEYPTWKDVESAGDDVRKTLRGLSHDVSARLRNPRKVTPEAVYDTYLQLPGPRMSHVPASLRHELLRALGMVERKNAKSMLRFFAVVADVKDSGFALLKGEWNAAISFASRYVGTSKASETEAAVNLWREMEQDAGILGNNVTFNILFDVASKSGNFTLAEMAYQEMEKRGLPFDRYHHVSLIHFFGLKLDADGMRAAYKDMVEAGEMIDVVVLNCVIAGFLRCGEEDAAERIYTHMHPIYKTRQQCALAENPNTTEADASSMAKTTRASQDTLTDTLSTPKAPSPSPGSFILSSPSHFSIPPSLITTNYKSQKVLTQVLKMLAKVSRTNEHLRAGFQYLMPTRPDLSTYRILINHHAARLGDLPAVTRYLDDMKTLRIPLHGAVFLALFKGFALHGGRAGTGSDWSEQRLRSIWAALLKALDDEVEDLYISTWLILWALRAFDRCSSPEMVFKAYNSLTSRWEPDEIEADFAIGVLHELLKSRREPSEVNVEESIGSSRHQHQRRTMHGWRGSRRRQVQTSVLGQLGTRSFG